MEEIIFSTPIGRLRLFLTPRGVYLLEKTDKPTKGKNSISELILKFLQGERVEFQHLEIDWEDYSPLEIRILKEVRKIPYGETRTYLWLAKKTGNPRGARYMGRVLSLNRTPIIIPCHRVIRSDGKIGGYSWGKELKEFLLKLENIRIQNPSS